MLEPSRLDQLRGFEVGLGGETFPGWGERHRTPVRRKDPLVGDLPRSQRWWMVGKVYSPYG